MTRGGALDAAPVGARTPATVAETSSGAETGVSGWLVGWHGRAIVWGVVLVAALLRLPSLGYQRISSDEGYTVAFTEHGFAGMLGLFRHEPNGMLYQFLVYPVAQLNASDAAFRLPAAIAGLLAIPALYWAGSMLVSRQAALIAAALLAVLPVAVQQSADARPYSLALLLAPISFGALLRATDGGGRRWWLLYVAAIVLGAYASALTPILLLPPQALLVLRRGGSVMLAWCRWLVLAAVLVIPIAILSVLDRRQRNPLYWLSRPTLHDLASSQATLLGGKREGLVMLVVMIAAGVALLVRRRRVRDGASAGGDGLVVAAWAFGPTLLAFVISQVSPILSTRYVMLAVPGSCLLAGLALARLPRWLAAPALVALLVVPLPTVLAYGRDRTMPDWRAAFAGVAAQRQPGDPVVVDTAEVIAPAGRYVPSFASPAGQLVVNEWHDARLPAQVHLLQDPGGYSKAPDGPPSARLVQELLAPTGRMFAVFAYVDGGKQGDVLDGAGVRWARSAGCRVAERAYAPKHLDGIEEGPHATVVSISGCRAPAS